jgi:hypothetical protein
MRNERYEVISTNQIVLRIYDKYDGCVYNYFMTHSHHYTAPEPTILDVLTSFLLF